MQRQFIMEPFIQGFPIAYVRFIFDTDLPQKKKITQDGQFFCRSSCRHYPWRKKHENVYCYFWIFQTYQNLCHQLFLLTCVVLIPLSEFCTRKLYRMTFFPTHPSYFFLKFSKEARKTTLQAFREVKQDEEGSFIQDNRRTRCISQNLFHLLFFFGC